MPLLFWCDGCSRPLTTEEETGGDHVECPACHTQCAVPKDAVVIDARKAARIRRRSEKPPSRLATDVPGAHTLISSAGAMARHTPTSTRADAPRKATIRVVTRDDLLPLCPHCSVELPEIYVRGEEIGLIEGRDVVYFCPHCRRVLGFGSARKA